VTITRANIHQTQLDKAIDDLRPSLGPHVVSLAYVLGEDWSGHPAIFFRIVLSEEASRCDRLLKATNQIEDVVRDGIQQLEQWGVSLILLIAALRSRLPGTIRRGLKRKNPSRMRLRFGHLSHTAQARGEVLLENGRRAGHIEFEANS